jgi:hypothetical protein
MYKPSYLSYLRFLVAQLWVVLGVVIANVTLTPQAYAQLIAEPGFIQLNDAEPASAMLHFSENLYDRQAYAAQYIDGIWKKRSANELIAYGRQGDTIVRLYLGKAYLFVKQIAKGPATLFYSDEQAIHTHLVQYADSSPFNPLASNSERFYARKNEVTTGEVLIPLILFPDGNLLYFNPADRAGSVAALRKHLPDYPATIPLPPTGNSNQRIPVVYFLDTIIKYNTFKEKEHVKMEAEYEKKQGF